MVEADLCIVGAGIMGSAAAYYASKERNRRTILVDQYSVGNDYCSSNDINRVFRYAYGKDEFYTRLAMESRKLWVQAERDTGTDLLVPSGLLLVQGKNETWNNFNEESHRTLQRLSLNTEILDREELAKQYPQFQADKAFLDPYGAVILASKALRNFADAAVRNGARLLSNARVAKLAKGKSGHVKVELANGQEIMAARVIVTIGPWSGNLTHPGMVGITPTRQQVLYFQPNEIEPYRPDRFPVFFAEDYYGIPAAGIDAVKTSHSGRNTPVSPETAKRSVDPEEAEACRKTLRRFIPRLATGKLASSKVCLYDMTSDKDFAIGPDPENGDIIYGYGFSGHGFKFAPFIGRTLARLALGTEPEVDIERFSLTRNTNRFV